MKKLNKLIRKEILKILYANLNTYLTTNEIAERAGISPVTAKRHLEKLEKTKYVSRKVFGMARTRFFSTAKQKKKVKIPSKILWILEFKGRVPSVAKVKLHHREKKKNPSGL
jgi:DNA-binding Lrp family transcriptional regulator